MHSPSPVSHTALCVPYNLPVTFISLLTYCVCLCAWLPPLLAPQPEAARRMEYQIMTALDWRLRVPTLYTFATMLVHRVTNRPQDGAVVPPGKEAAFRATVQQLTVSVCPHEDPVRACVRIPSYGCARAISSWRRRTCP